MSAPAEHKSSTFASLTVRNYRLFASGQLVSNTGVWVQRIAQDWLVLTITGSATAVGITTALQFLPTLLFGLYGGAIADRFDKRRVLILTNLGMSIMASALAALALTGVVEAWHVFVIAFVLGTITAIDNPTRQSFVNELVGGEHLRNAIGLNASIFQLGALIGPAISGFMINSIGAGASFAINAVSYAGPICALLKIDETLLNRADRNTAPTYRLVDAVHYARSHAEILWPTILVGVFGMFSINLPVTLAAYAKTEFHSGASGYGLLASAVALGSIFGALTSARGGRVRLRALVLICASACGVMIIASTASAQWPFLLLLVLIGATTLRFLTAANSTVQMAADDTIRGRVMGIYVLVFIGSGALGGPILGAIDEYLSPRAGLLLSGVVPAIASVLVSAKLAHDSRLRLSFRPLGQLRPLVSVVSR